MESVRLCSCVIRYHEHLHTGRYLTLVSVCQLRRPDQAHYKLMTQRSIPLFCGLNRRYPSSDCRFFGTPQSTHLDAESTIEYAAPKHSRLSHHPPPSHNPDRHRRPHSWRLQLHQPHRRSPDLRRPSLDIIHHSDQHHLNLTLLLRCFSYRRHHNTDKSRLFVHPCPRHPQFHHWSRDR